MPRKKKQTTPRDSNIFFILEGSGSMAVVQDDVVEGLNEFVRTNASDGSDTRFWLTVFDTQIYKVTEGEDIKSVRKFSSKDTFRCGATALLDAYGKTLSELTNANSTKNRKNQVIVYTDGFENSSREYTKETISKLREELEARGNWTFTFMGADQDAWANSRALGVVSDVANTLSVDSSNTADAFAALASASVSHKLHDRAGKKASYYK